MVAIHTPLDKGAVYTPVVKTCRATVPRGMMRSPKNWARINDLSSLWPEGQFRTAALDAARRFVADMERQGFDLITPEADVLVYGPIRHRDFSGAAAPTWTPAPGASPTFRTQGFAFADEHESDAEDFLLRAKFLAKRVHMIEYIIREDETA